MASSSGSTSAWQTMMQLTPISSAAADHVRLVAADHDAARVGEHQVLPAGGQGDGDLTGDHVPHLAALVENFALQHGEQVVHRDLAAP